MAVGSGKMSTEEFRAEVKKKERFEFGKNWAIFLGKLDDERIQRAENSLCEMLGTEDLRGRKFLDIGSGSGLSSLAAKNKGANVTSFDFDESSVWCTSELKRMYHESCDDWTVMQGSVLDRDFLASLGKHDVVYSWGVLHHTGRMWGAIDNSLELVDENGVYFIAIYNDQGFKSHAWWIVKYCYNKLPKFLQKPFAYSLWVLVKFLLLVKYTLKLKPMVVIRPMFKYKEARGMSMLSDVPDWYGGFPFEFANYDYLKEYIENNGFRLVNGKEASSLGCHELVFVRTGRVQTGG